MHVCLNGTCIHTYWPGFVGFMKCGAFYVKTGTFCEKHMKSTENWKAHEKWKHTQKWEVPEKWKTHEKHMKIEKHMKSIPEKWKHLKSEKHMKS